MLQITVPAVNEREFFDEETQTFFYSKPIKEQTIVLEHSLVSISKWEAKWHKPFLTKEQKTNEEMIDYIRFMTLTQNVPADTYNNLSADNIKQINEYIDNPMTATKVFSNKKTEKGKQKTITSELIYSWMVGLQIPFECQKWHINRLLTLIQVCDANNDTSKMSKKETMAQNRALNAARRAKMHSKG